MRIAIGIGISLLRRVAASVPPSPGDAPLLESGDYILLENGDKLLLE